MSRKILKKFQATNPVMKVSREASDNLAELAKKKLKHSEEEAMDYYTTTSTVGDDYICHRSHKYISRVWKNGKWQYYYANVKNGLSSLSNRLRRVGNNIAQFAQNTANYNANKQQRNMYAAKQTISGEQANKYKAKYSENAAKARIERNLASGSKSRQGALVNKVNNSIQGRANALKSGSAMSNIKNAKSVATDTKNYKTNKNRLSAATRARNSHESNAEYYSNEAKRAQKIANKSGNSAANSARQKAAYQKKMDNSLQGKAAYVSKKAKSLASKTKSKAKKTVSNAKTLYSNTKNYEKNRQGYIASKTNAIAAKNNRDRYEQQEKKHYKTYKSYDTKAKIYKKKKDSLGYSVASDAKRNAFNNYQSSARKKYDSQSAYTKSSKAADSYKSKMDNSIQVKSKKAVSSAKKATSKAQKAVNNFINERKAQQKRVNSNLQKAKKSGKNLGGGVTASFGTAKVTKKKKR